MNERLTWFKSSHSDSEGDACVEIAFPGEQLTVQIRDSKNPTGPTLTLRAPAWAAFVSAGRPGA